MTFPKQAYATVLLPLAGLLTSCASTQQRTSDIATAELPTYEEWSNRTATAAISRQGQDTEMLRSWWMQFDDPLLTELIATGIENSPDVDSALARVREARARIRVERSSLFPTLSGGVNGSGSETRNHDSDTTSSSESYGASIDASWEVDLFGKQILSVSAAEANFQESLANLESVHASLASEIALTYLSLRSSEMQLSITAQNLALREETTQLAQWREEAGTGDALSTQQSLTSLQQARANIPSLRQSIAETRNTLALLCGFAPGEFESELSIRRTIPEPPNSVAIGIPADTLRQRPDVRAAESSLQASVALAKNAERQRLPSLTLRGSIGIDALHAGDLLSPESTIANIAASLTAPIFQAGKISRNIEIQQLQVEQAAASYKSVALNALHEVENALIAIEETGNRLQLLNTALESAQLSAELAQIQYEAGLTDIINVIDAQSSLLSMQEQTTSATAERTAAYVQLYKALGGGWQPIEEFAENQN